MSGSLALVELNDRQGLGVDEAIATSLWAVSALIEATRQQGAVADGVRTTRKKAKK